MFENLKDRLARMIFNYPPPVRLITPTLISRIHESGWSDTSVDDWFYKDDVIKAVKTLKKSAFPITNIRIDEIFGDLTKDFEDIHPDPRVKKRFMTCTECGETSFEVFHEELIHNKTQAELSGFYFNLGACGTTQIRCLGCGAIGKLKARFKKEE